MAAIQGSDFFMGGLDGTVCPWVRCRMEIKCAGNSVKLLSACCAPIGHFIQNVNCNDLKVLKQTILGEFIPGTGVDKAGSRLPWQSSIHHDFRLQLFRLYG